MQQPVRIAPSILSADFARLGEEVRAIDAAGADWIHVDVMDGHFVPNITIGPAMVKALRPHSAKPFDVHLMISPVDAFVAAFAEAGADIITVHPEAGPHLHRTIQLIKSLGKRAGVSLNPATPAKMLDYVLEEADLVLIMSVNPGFGGQSFIDSQLRKVEAVRKQIDKIGKAIDLEVDGGIDAANCRRAVEAGADVLVAGTATFRGGPDRYAANISGLRGVMSLLEKIEPAVPEAEIEPGKRMIRVGDDRGVSLAERLSARLHRLAWRTPFHAIRLRGRYPLRLLAVPKDPIAGDKALGEALLQGGIVLGASAIPIEGLDFANPALPSDLSDYLQSFAWLRNLAAAATRERGAKTAETLTAKWLATHAAQVDERGWRADLWARRILFCAAYAPYILSSRDMVYKSALLNALARGARHLEKGAARAPAGLARITAWSGVIASALVIQGGPARLKSGEAGLARALAASLHEDGGLISRSPTEQLALVELFAQLRAVYLAVDTQMPEPLADALDGAVSVLLASTLGDGALSSWQSGNMLSRARVAAALDGAGVRARSLRQARGWGYQRLEARKTVILFDAAPPPPSRVFSGGCASTLAFELSDGANRMIVNCGGVGDATGSLPAELGKALRTTAAHSTLTLGDRNSTAIHEDGTLGKGVGQVELAMDETAGITQAEASHDGYVRRFGLLHQRQLTLSGDGAELSGQDSLIAQGRKRRAEPTPFAVRFHLAPAVEVATTADGQGALLRVKGGAAWQFRCRGGALAVEDSLWVDGAARAQGSLQLVVSGESPPDGMTITWQLRRAG